MSANFELLARFLVNVRRAQHREFLDLSRQRDRTAYSRASALRRVDDLTRRLIQHSVIVRAQSNANILIVNGHEGIPSADPQAALSI
jgi:hypothetical protein